MTPELALLIDRAKDTCLAAKKLHAGDYPDFATLHACDAIFFVTLALLEHEGLIGARHPFLSRMLSEVLVKPGKIGAEYQRYLMEAENARRLADDHLHDMLTVEDAIRHIAHAEAFIKLAEERLS